MSADALSAPSADLPSRPSLIELTIVCAAVLLVGGSLAVGLARTLDDRAEREADVRRLLATGGEGADGARRFEAREQLVDANLGVLLRYLDAQDAADESEFSTLADAVEALAASRHSQRADVRSALSQLVERLDEVEQEVGFLDLALESARELAQDALAPKER